jgi:hypothetical protein
MKALRIIGKNCISNFGRDPRRSSNGQLAAHASTRNVVKKPPTSEARIPLTTAPATLPTIAAPMAFLLALPHHTHPCASLE